MYSHSRRGSQYFVHLGLGSSNSSHKGRADILSPCLLCPGHQPWLQSLLLLLQWWQHRSVGPAQPDPGEVSTGSFLGEAANKRLLLLSVDTKANCGQLWVRNTVFPYARVSSTHHVPILWSTLRWKVSLCQGTILCGISDNTRASNVDVLSLARVLFVRTEIYWHKTAKEH